MHVDPSPSSPSLPMSEAAEAGYPVVTPSTAAAVAEVDALRRSMVDAAWEAAGDRLAIDETVSRARLVELLRRAQAERDAAAEEARRLDSRLTVAAIELDALRQQAAVYGDPSEPLSVACALLHRVDLHEFADGLALVREAREWAGLAFMHNRAA